MELTSIQFSQSTEHLPAFKPHYETSRTDSDMDDYNIGMGIPVGKKGYIWFTFQEDRDVCYLINLNRDKKMSHASLLTDKSIHSLSLGTILYGTHVVCEESTQSFFVVEDIYYYHGVSLSSTRLMDRFACITDVIGQCPLIGQIQLCSPILWKRDRLDPLDHTIPIDYIDVVGYPVHHVQYRTLDTIRPHLNVYNQRKLTIASSVPQKISLTACHISQYTMDFTKPQYRCQTAFQVMADVQYDIYHLYAYGKDNATVYYGIAYIPDYKTSIRMNNLFRQIRENDNLDYIEESDDEDDFQNIQGDKHVDLKKRVVMDCVFSPKFKRWTPIRIAPARSKIVHMSRLVRDFYGDKQRR